MLIQNGITFMPDHRFTACDLAIDNGIITKTAPPGTLKADHVINAQGRYIVPGFLDIHIHGSAGCDFCDGTQDSFEKIARYLGKNGITSFLGTSMALEESTLLHIFGEAGKWMNQQKDSCSVMRGIHMEGPFFSMEKKGAQNEKYIIHPDLEMFERLNQASNGNIRIVDVAPELPQANSFIQKAAKFAAVSIAHTTADYDCALAAFQAGASHVGHLFNAMPPFNHRSPGVIGAASDAGAFVEIISDGHHLHPATVRSAFRWFGPEKICLVSDAMRACGMPDGEYSLGGQLVKMASGKATLSDGTLAGSATNLADCFRQAVSFGIPMEDALRAATENPARSTGIFDMVGSIQAGKRADLLILEKDLSLQEVIIGGKTIRSVQP